MCVCIFGSLGFGLRVGALPFLLKGPRASSALVGDPSLPDFLIHAGREGGGGGGGVRV